MKAANLVAWIDHARHMPKVQIMVAVLCLFATFPAIRQLATKRTRPPLHDYSNFSKTERSVVVHSDPCKLSGQEPRRLALPFGKTGQDCIIRDIKAYIRHNDLPGAQALTACLTDDASLIEGYTALLPALPPDQARRIYDAERSRLQEVRDPVDQLRALVARPKHLLLCKTRPALPTLLQTQSAKEWPCSWKILANALKAPLMNAMDTQNLVKS